MYYFTINGQTTMPMNGVSGSATLNYESILNFKDYLLYDSDGEPVLSEQGLFLLDEKKIVHGQLNEDQTLMSPVLQIGNDTIFQYLNIEICLDTFEWFGEGRPYEIGVHRIDRSGYARPLQFMEVGFGFHTNTYECTDHFGMNFHRLSLEAPLELDFQITEYGMLLKRILYTIETPKPLFPSLLGTTKCFNKLWGSVPENNFNNGRIEFAERKNLKHMAVDTIVNEMQMLKI